MALIQKRNFHDVPYTGGLCLKATQDAYSPPDNFQKQGWAMPAWDLEVKSGAGKTTLPPKGVDVPIWFDLTKLSHDRSKRGHIAISRADGSVASASLSGSWAHLYIHKNISDLIKFYGQGIKYLGWSSWLEGVQIIKEVGVPAGYEPLDKIRHGAQYKKTDSVTFACDKGSKGGVIKFLYYAGRQFKAPKTITLTSNHTTTPLASPRDGARVKFDKDCVIGFDANLNPTFIYQSSIDWT
jgi:hypothetical protein